MTDNMRYAKFDNNILSDVFGEEVVLVNLDSGMYYSLRGSATQIWIRLFNQYSLFEILADLIQIYQVTENQLIDDINLFVTQLLELKIIKTANDAVRKEIDFISKDVLIDYSTPVVEIFSDMQEILLLDPVHDVDKSGWPISKNSDNPPS
jgi:hypothetical protein